MRAVIILAMKDLRLLARDKAGFFFTFIFPILYACLFGAIMSGFSGAGRGGGLRLAVVDEDRTSESEEFVRRLERSAEFRVQRSGRAEAAESVRLGQRAAYVVLPKGFGDSRRRLFWGEAPEIEIGIDPVRQAEAALVRGVLTGMLYEGFHKLFTDPNFVESQVDEALAGLERDEQTDPALRGALRVFLPALTSFLRSMPAAALANEGFKPAELKTVSVAQERHGPRSAYQITFPQGMVWAIMGCAAGFGVSLVVERTRGTLTRLLMGPLSRTQILAGKGLACLLTTLAVAAVLFGVGAAFFGVRADSYLKLTAALLCVALAFVGVMMTLAVLGRTEQSAGGIGWAVLLVMAMIGGGMIPLAFLPAWVQSLASVSPIKWSILAIEGAVWRNFSAAEMLRPCLILLGIGAACFALGARLFRWTD